MRRKKEKQTDRTAVWLGRGHALLLRLEMKTIGIIWVSGDSTATLSDLRQEVTDGK